METFTIMSFEDFVKSSASLDRKIHKIPEASKTIFDNIKKKVGILDNNIRPGGEKLHITTFTKQAGSLSELFKLLNKVTDKSYDKLQERILVIVSSTGQEKEVCDKFFSIITASSFYCGLYAKLYSELIKRNPDYKAILCEKTDKYLLEFESFAYVSPNEDYDGYCDYVKVLDNIKNFTRFLLKCLDFEVLGISDIINIIIGFQETVIHNISNIDSIYKNEIYISNIHIMIEESLEVLKKHHLWDTVLLNHIKLSSLTGDGKSKKLFFNIMDISDIINK